MSCCNKVGILFAALQIGCSLASAQDAAAPRSRQPVPTCALADNRVETFIASKARELGGREHCQFRRYHTLDDLDGDRQGDFIVLFNADLGGSASVDFLAVWLSTRAGLSPAVVQVSEPEKRTGVSVTVGPDRKIHVETAEWRSGDANCCPSGKGELVYDVRRDWIELVASRTQKPRSGRPRE